MERAAVVALAVSGCVVGQTAGSSTSGPNEEVEVRGRTIDYFTNVPVSETRLETIGLARERSAISDNAAAFALEVPVGSHFFVRTAASENHRPTVTDIQSDATDVVLVSRADVVRQHTTAGVSVAENTTAVFVELATLGGSPLQTFSRSNLTIVDPMSLRTIAQAPLIAGPLGDVDPTLETASGAAARFVFLNVEVGSFALRIACATCQPAVESEYPLISSAGATVMHASLGGVQGPPADSFATIAPLFRTGADGGLGCANCHHAGASIPAFDAAPDQVRDTILESSLVDLGDPDRSQLLARPLYETPADHPNATFLSTSDPGYRAIRAWIAAGAK